MSLKVKIKNLQDRLYESTPEFDEDGIIGDGSYETMYSVYERAFNEVFKIAEEAIGILIIYLDE